MCHPLRYRLGERIDGQVRFSDKLHVDEGARFRSVCTTPKLRSQPLRRSSDGNGFEQRTERYLAGVTVEIVYAPVTGIVPMNNEVAVIDDFEPPRLRIVAARRPARQIEDGPQFIGQRGCIHDQRSFDCNVTIRSLSPPTPPRPPTADEGSQPLAPPSARPNSGEVLLHIAVPEQAHAEPDRQGPTGNWCPR